MYFWRALLKLDELPLSEPRREQARQLAGFFLKTGYEDLALLAFREAILVSEELRNGKALAGDLIDSANVHVRLGNTRAARVTFENVIGLCLSAEDYSQAASASTNLAGIIANDDPKRALELLKNSLDYVAKEPFPHTEFVTHATMIQVVGHYGGDPELAVNSGIALGERFSDSLGDTEKEVLAPLLRKAVDDYLEDNSEDDPAAWKKQKLAWAYPE